jgi:hypothetical protein
MHSFRGKEISASPGIIPTLKAIASTANKASIFPNRAKLSGFLHEAIHKNQ